MDGLLGPILASSKGKDSPDILGDQGNQAASTVSDAAFVNAYHENVEAFRAAKSGTVVPSAATVIANNGAENASVELDFEYKTLSGGTQLLLGGDEPTADGVNEFAKSQGIDAQLLTLLMRERPAADHPDSAKLSSLAEGLESDMDKPLGQPTNTMISAEEIEHGNSIISHQRASSVKDATDADGLKLAPHLSTRQPMTDINNLINYEHKNPSTGAIKNNMMAATDSAKLESSNPPLKMAKTAEGVDLKVTSLVNLTDVRGFQQKQVSDQKPVLGQKQVSDQMLSYRSVGLKPLQKSSMDLLNRSTESPKHLSSPLMNTNLEVSDAVPETPKSNKTAEFFLLTNARDEAKPLQKSSMDLLNRSTESPKHLSSPLMNTNLEVSDAVPETPKSNKTAEFFLLTNARDEAKRQESTLERSRLKLPAIDLLDTNVTVPRPTASELSTGALVKALAPGEHGSTLLGHLAAAEPKANSVQSTHVVNNAQSADRLLLTRQEQYIDISRRMSEALGQRLSAQIQKGAWQVELDLHPKSLGRIEIQLEMKNGELEAYFNASKSVTRDLLQDGMQRLRQELDQHGIETAYVGLGAGNHRENDEKSTPSEALADTAKETTDDINEVQSVMPSTKLSDDGLDISV